MSRKRVNIKYRLAPRGTQRRRNQDRTIREAYRRTGGYDVEGEEITYAQFRHRVIFKMSSEKLTAKQASLKELNTEVFVSKAQRSRNNLIDAIKDENPALLQEMYRINRQLRDEKGHFTSLRANMKWDKSKNGYVFGDDFVGQYLIDVSNSPKEIFITKIA